MKGRNPLASERARRKGRQSPVLAVRIEEVRRRANLTPPEYPFVAPGLATTAVHADRQVGDQSDPHAGVASFHPAPRQESGRRAIAESTETESPVHALRKTRGRPCSRGRATRRANAPVPRHPIGCASRAACRVSNSACCWQRARRARCEIARSRCQRGRRLATRSCCEVFEQPAEDCNFGAAGSWPIDQLGAFEFARHCPIASRHLWLAPRRAPAE